MIKRVEELDRLLTIACNIYGTIKLVVFKGLPYQFNISWVVFCEENFKAYFMSLAKATGMHPAEELEIRQLGDRRGTAGQAGGVTFVAWIPPA